ncbi:MAG: type II toxin-antitoxin system VapC family toxin [Spirochaetes bacterium]|nr:type II toxin-antitoxin system VapC family toxin [Spirochaetota bacterium]MBL7005560.1 type II toxin-antitoxin system VapC family toxin [Spirochaetia bacterium]
MYLLDTNTIIYFFKGLGKVAETLLSKAPEDIAIPAIVLYELEVGIAKSSNPKKRKIQLESLVSRITVLPFTEKEAEISAKIRAELEKQGAPIGSLDNLIAGIALYSNTVLVTHNLKEFSRVKGLIIEDWF